MPTPAERQRAALAAALRPGLRRQPRGCSLLLVARRVRRRARRAARPAGRETQPAVPAACTRRPRGSARPRRSTCSPRRVDDEAFVATLMHAAEKGAIDLDRDDGWTITDKAGPPAGPGSTRSPPASPSCSAAPGTSFTADSRMSGRPAAQERVEPFDDRARAWARQNGLIVTQRARRPRRAAGPARRGPARWFFARLATRFEMTHRSA